MNQDMLNEDFFGKVISIDQNSTLLVTHTNIKCNHKEEKIVNERKSSKYGRGQYGGA